MESNSRWCVIPSSPGWIECQTTSGQRWLRTIQWQSVGDAWCDGRRQHLAHENTLNRLKESVRWLGWSEATCNMLAQCQECLVEAQVPRVPMEMCELSAACWHAVLVDVFNYCQLQFLSLIDVWSHNPAVAQLRKETTSSSDIITRSSVYSACHIKRYLTNVKSSAARFKNKL